MPIILTGCACGPRRWLISGRVTIPMRTSSRHRSSGLAAALGEPTTVPQSTTSCSSIRITLTGCGRVSFKQGKTASMCQFDGIPIDGNPFEIGNNVNSVSCGGICPSDNSQISAQAWSYEQVYLQKVIDTVNDLDNVMYEISNEAGSPYSDSWQASVISFVKSYEARKPKQHPVGMTFQYQGGTDVTLYKSQADWVSPSTTLPPETSGNKVIINDTDHSYCWSCMKSAGHNAQR